MASWALADLTPTPGAPSLLAEKASAAESPAPLPLFTVWFAIELLLLLFGLGSLAPSPLAPC